MMETEIGTSQPAATPIVRFNHHSGRQAFANHLTESE
jgi:hypothetical protein